MTIFLKTVIGAGDLEPGPEIALDIHRGHNRRRLIPGQPVARRIHAGGQDQGQGTQKKQTQFHGDTFH